MRQEARRKWGESTGAHARRSLLCTRSRAHAAALPRTRVPVRRRGLRRPSCVSQAANLCGPRLCGPRELNRATGSINGTTGSLGAAAAPPARTYMQSPRRLLGGAVGRREHRLRLDSHRRARRPRSEHWPHADSRRAVPLGTAAARPEPRRLAGNDAGCALPAARGRRQAAHSRERVNRKWEPLRWLAERPGGDRAALRQRERACRRADERPARD